MAWDAPVLETTGGSIVGCYHEAVIASPLDPKAKAELQEVCDRIARGETFSREERKAAAARIDKLREENAKKFGIQNVAVDLVRQSRDSR